MSRENKLRVEVDNNSNCKLRTHCNYLTTLVLTLIVLLSVFVEKSEMVERDRRTKIGNENINRISYGVYFQYQQKTQLTTQTWEHWFVIKMPKRVFDEEQNFLDQLSLGETPAKALCVRSNEGTYFTNGFKLLQTV